MQIHQALYLCSTFRVPTIPNSTRFILIQHFYVSTNANSSGSRLMQHFQGSNHRKFNKIYTYSALLWYQPMQIYQALFLFSTFTVPNNANSSGSIHIQHLQCSYPLKFNQIYTYSALLWFQPMQIH